MDGGVREFDQVTGRRVGVVAACRTPGWTNGDCFLCIPFFGDGRLDWTETSHVSLAQQLAIRR